MESPEEVLIEKDSRESYVDYATTRSTVFVYRASIE